MSHQVSAARNINFDELESQAAILKVINNGNLNKNRKGGLPSSVKNDKNFVFGIKSDLDMYGRHSSTESPVGMLRRDKGTSSMQ